MPGKRTVTIKDIARLAGVSKATVSRVLNHKPDVDPDTRERILRIVEEEGFVPSIAASDLAGGHSRLIGALVPSFTWPMIPDIMRGVAEAMSDTHYELVLYSINDSVRDLDRSKVIDHILASKLTSGLLAIFPGPVSHHLTKLYKQRFPVVMIDDQDEPTDIPWLKSDNINGAYAAVHHLLQLGHRRIAHIQGPLRRHLVSHERHQGYCQALEEVGIIPDPDLIVEGDFTVVGGRACAAKLFELPVGKRPTAIFASSDQMAYGVLAAAEEYGISVPRDMALVGFDDLAPSPHVHPPLTTVRQPFVELGRYGIELLLSMLDKPHTSPSDKNGLSSENDWYSFSTVSTPTGQLQQGTNGNNKPVHLAMATTLIVRASSGAHDKLIVGT